MREMSGGGIGNGVSCSYVPNILFCEVRIPGELLTET